MRKLTEKQVDAEIREMADQEFLTKVVYISRLYGWEGDNVETSNFLNWLFDKTIYAIPDITPFETDNDNNTIIP